jgi:hypothetical protein
MKLADVAVYGGSGDELLRNSDFNVDQAKDTVVVTNAKTDRHTIQGIAIMGEN